MPLIIGSIAIDGISISIKAPYKKTKPACLITQGHTGIPFAKLYIFSIFANIFVEGGDMKYQDYEVAFSSARLSKYVMVCGGDTTAALTLYRSNIQLCQKFYGLLNVFEVVLRNAINEHFRLYYSDSDWICNQLGKGGLLESYPQSNLVRQTITTLLASRRYTNDRVVSSVSLGFWTYLFTKVPYQRGGRSLLQIFPLKSKGLGQRAIFNELQSIKSFRNRIAHHEAICFDSTGAKSTTPAKDYYALILKYVRFLGYDESHLFYGLNVLPDKVLHKIDTL